MDKLRVGLAPLKLCESIEHGVDKICAVLDTCKKQNVDIVCFPEAYIPGLRGTDVQLPPYDQEAMERALQKIKECCRKNRIYAIVGMEWLSDIGLENRAYVISSSGDVCGYQTKNQITPGGESQNYVADGRRGIFEVNGVKFGIVICHEGWRYPETARWAAIRGAKVIFQPQWTGSDMYEKPDCEWGVSIYEKAMVCRAIENDIYFVSVNTVMRGQNSATSIIEPNGNVMAYVPRGKEELLVRDLDLSRATGFHAFRYDPGLYPD